MLGIAQFAFFGVVADADEGAVFLVLVAIDQLAGGAQTAIQPETERDADSIGDRNRGNRQPWRAGEKPGGQADGKQDRQDEAVRNAVAFQREGRHLANHQPGDRDQEEAGNRR